MGAGSLYSVGLPTGLSGSAELKHEHTNTDQAKQSKPSQQGQTTSHTNQMHDTHLAARIWLTVPLAVAVVGVCDALFVLLTGVGCSEDEAELTELGLETADREDRDAADCVCPCVWSSTAIVSCGLVSVGGSPGKTRPEATGLEVERGEAALSLSLSVCLSFSASCNRFIVPTCPPDRVREGTDCSSSSATVSATTEAKRACCGDVGVGAAVLLICAVCVAVRSEAAVAAVCVPVFCVDVAATVCRRAGVLVVDVGADGCDDESLPESPEINNKCARSFEDDKTGKVSRINNSFEAKANVTEKKRGHHRNDKVKSCT